ncbi:MAG: N-acetylmuramoyl-L-alanine amidase [Sandaracinaceae bacterium]|nr:N-acetylmuramoyl-L-alanine amidase [Sandaracinaceae bacterium]
MPQPNLAGPVRAAPAAAAAATPVAVLEGIDVLAPTGAAGAHNSARVVLRFDRPTAFTRTNSPAVDGAGGRVRIHFERARLRADVPRSLRVNHAGVARIRSDATRDGGAEVAFEVADSTRYHIFFLPQPYRVIIDFDEAPRGASAALNSPGAPLAHALRLIMLDPGHGGDDHGAPGEAGLRESRLVLDIAKRVRARLHDRLPQTRVMLTRENDTFVSLEQRAAMANVVEADLFISIHLNASPTEADRGGVATFVLDTSGDRQALRLAALENGTSENEVSELEALLASLQRQDQVAESRLLATRIHYSTLSWGRRFMPSLNDRGVRSALFYVLVGARMPSVLVEASFVLRAPEAPMLARDDYRDALAVGIAEGVVRYAQGR